MPQRDAEVSSVVSIENGNVTLPWLAILVLIGLGYIAGNYVALRWWERQKKLLTAQIDVAIAQERARADTLAAVVDRLTGGGSTVHEPTSVVAESPDSGTRKSGGE